MNLDIEILDNVAIVTLPGKFLNASNHEKFMADIKTTLEAQARVILDVGQLDSIDSSGLGALAFCRRKILDAGGIIKICSPTPPVQTAFGLVHIDRIIDVFDNRQDALQSIEN